MNLTWGEGKGGSSESAEGGHDDHHDILVWGEGNVTLVSCDVGREGFHHCRRPFSTG